MNEKLNLMQKLNEAAKSIGAVHKDGKNSFQNYDFQSEGAIKAAVEQAIQGVGIRIIPNYQVINQYDKESKRGGSNHFVDVMGTFLITDGAETETGSMPGSGQDSGEKAMAKACTSAQKYFYKQLFNITDKEEDPDTTDSNATVGESLINNEQRDRLDRLFESLAGVTNKDKEFVAKAYLKKVGSIDKLTHSSANTLIEMVTNKLNSYVDKEEQSA
ncbi:ERF family protein [Lactiplantibacillus plantarum]|uniref:ERF family protein n=1 Tax=Lactiplantibacillus plantarum TaxID=1590 RepID=UPI003B508778